MIHSQKLLFACTFWLFVTVSSIVALPAANAQIQSEMITKTDKDFKAADVKLNQVYETLLKKIDRQSQAKLRTAQRAWLAYRDAQADFYSDLAARHGSIMQMVACDNETILTRERTKELEKALKYSSL